MPEGPLLLPGQLAEKVAAMDMQPGEDRIAIKLQAKPGTTFDTDEIAACLDYTVARTQS